MRRRRGKNVKRLCVPRLTPARGVRVSGHGCNATGFSRKRGNNEALEFNQKAPVACRHWCLVRRRLRSGARCSRAGPWYVALDTSTKVGYSSVWKRRICYDIAYLKISAQGTMVASKRFLCALCRPAHHQNSTLLPENVSS
jgi:hypothetical protein